MWLCTFYRGTEGSDFVIPKCTATAAPTPAVRGLVVYRCTLHCLPPRWRNSVAKLRNGEALPNELHRFHAPAECGKKGSQKQSPTAQRPTVRNGQSLEAGIPAVARNSLIARSNRNQSSQAVNKWPATCLCKDQDALCGEIARCPKLACQTFTCIPNTFLEPRARK